MLKICVSIALNHKKYKFYLDTFFGTNIYVFVKHFVINNKKQFDVTLPISAQWWIYVCVINLRKA